LHKWNLKDPQDTNAAFRLVFSGGWTHSSTGATPNGTNAFANSFLVPSTTITLNSIGLSYYSRTNTTPANNSINMGSWVGAGLEYTILAIRSYLSSTRTYGILQTSNAGTFAQFVDANALGLYTITRTANNLTKIFKNGISSATNSALSSANSSNSIYLGAVNGNTQNYSNRECAFASITDGLTDADAANFYTAVQNFQTTIGRAIGIQTVSDPDAQAFVTAADIQDQVQAQAINNLTISLKNYGIWSKMKAIYPFVGGTASSHKWNLKDPRDLDAAFRLTFTGGWTHSVNGALPNGTNGYANTFLSPSTSLTNNNTHMSYYSRTNTQGANKGLIGASVGGSFIPLYTIYGRSGSNVFFMDSYNYNTNRNQQAEPTGQSFLLSTRISNTSFKSFRNNSLVATGVNTNADNVTGINFPISIGGLNLGGSVSQFSDFQCAFSSIGDGLTDTEAANFYTAVQSFNTALARNI
jgi:hypothetical protein